MDRSCSLLHGQPRQPFVWNYFPLLTGKIVLSNKKRNLRKYSVFFLKHFPKKKKVFGGIFACSPTCSKLSYKAILVTIISFSTTTDNNCPSMMLMSVVGCFKLHSKLLRICSCLFNLLQFSVGCILFSYF